MLPNTIEELKVRTAMRSRPPSFPCNEGRVRGAEQCQWVTNVLPGWDPPSLPCSG